MVRKIHNKFKLIVIIISVCLTYSLKSQSRTERIAQNYINALSTEKQLDKLMDLYADSVLLVDPIWGGQEVYLKEELREMYKQVLDDANGLTYDFSATAVDKKAGIFIVKGVVTDKDGKRTDFNSNLTVKNGKIVNQTDFIAYPVEDLKSSERFSAYLKPELSEVDQRFLDATNLFIKAFKERNTDRFVSVYQDSVLYRDQIYDSSDRLSLATLKELFGGFFDEKNGWQFTVVASAVDMENRMLMIKLNTIDPQGENGEYAGWFKFEGGKIVEQLDFSMYPIKDVLESPRFKKYFEENDLEVKPKTKQ